MVLFDRPGISIRHAHIVNVESSSLLLHSYLFDLSVDREDSLTVVELDDGLANRTTN